MLRANLWMVVAASLGLGLLLGLPLGLLAMFHEGPWTGFVWDLLVRLPFLLVCALMVLHLAGALRARQFKDAGKLLVVLAFFGAMTLFAWYGFVRHVSSLVHFRSIRAEQVRAVRLACHTTDDSRAVEQIVQDLRGAQWYSPDSHGWQPYVPLAIIFADGHREDYSLTKVLAEGRLVILVPKGDRNLLAVPHLRDSMEAAGLLQVASYPRYDKKGLYEALVPDSVCLSEQPGR